MLHRVGLFLLLCAVAACGGNTKTGPSVARVDGRWSGTLESSNFTTVPVLVDLTQADADVNGTWASSDASDWNGLITGTVTRTSFSGQITLSAPATFGGGRCTGSASVSGGAGATTLVWTSPGFSGTCTGMPVGLTVRLQPR